MPPVSLSSHTLSSLPVSVDATIMGDATVEMAPKRNKGKKLASIAPKTKKGGMRDVQK
jgi:hypothetical protein